MEGRICHRARGETASATFRLTQKYSPGRQVKVSEHSGLEGEIEGAEQKRDSAEACPAPPQDESLEEIVSEYKPSLLTKGLVAVLRGTSIPVDTTDYSEMGSLERFFRKYIVRPITRPKDYILTPFAGFWLRVLVGGTSGGIMTEAAGYLEKELGIKETPLEYTRNNLLICLTAGAVMTLGMSGLGFSLPVLVPASAAVGPVFGSLNPLIYASDIIRRLWLYSQKKPSGPWMFEAGWWAKNRVTQYVVEPLKEYVSETLVPKLKHAYETRIVPPVEKMKRFWTERIEPQLQYFSSPFSPSFYQTFPAEHDDSKGKRESILYDYTVERINENPENPAEH